MAAATTPALVLHALAYGDTSKILRLLTRDLGLQSVIAKGARRAKARTGPRLDLFAQGEAGIAVKRNRELQTLTAFEVTVPHAGLAGDVERFAAASAVAELVLRFAPADAHPDLFDATAAALDALEHAPAELVGSVGLLACWGVVVALGFSPALERCVVCRTPLEGRLAFSAAQGGALCDRHRRGLHVSTLAEGDRAALTALAGGRLPDPPLDRRHEAAHRRLLGQFIRTHLAEHRPMPALAFWERQAWTTSS
jgi:DNA repair protein RecO (recombination protein O)